MKRRRIEKIFLEELERLSNIFLACKAVGIRRQTYYRWKEQDPSFAKKAEKALSMGRESICDLAKGKLTEQIKDGRPWAIKYYLDNNDLQYYRPRKPIRREEERCMPVKEIHHHIVNDKNKHLFSGLKLRKDVDLGDLDEDGSKNVSE